MISNNDVSFEMFSSRAAATLDEQLKLLAELGYTDVQPFFFGRPENMEAVRDYAALLKKYGLTAKSGHFTVDLFDKAPDLVEAIAEAFGMWLVVDPWVDPEERPTTAEGWKAIGRQLEGHATEMKRRGLTFAYHNHDFEMQPLPDASYPLEHLLGENVAFEPDLAWMVVGGADPLAWLRKYSGRVLAVHVKDIAPAGENLDEKGFADLGYGTLDWNTLWDASVEAGSRLMILEHDLPSDWRRFARRSIGTMRTLGKRTS